MDLTVVGPTMTLAEAREITDRIKNNLTSARQLLLEMYERGGWKALGYSSWREYGQVEFGYSETHIYRLMDAAQVERNISPIGEMLIPEGQLRPLTRLQPDEQIAAWQEAVDTAPNGKVTAAHVAEVVGRRFGGIVTCPVCNNFYDGQKFDGCPYCVAAAYGATSPLHVRDELLPIKKAHVSNNSGENEWYTPPEYINAAHAVMGGIDLDPASSDIANQTVKAAKYYTAQDDGLAHSWKGRVWLNPPYAQPLIGYFANALLWAVKSGEVTEAITLTNNATETAWFADLLAIADAVCFTRGRIRFLDIEGKPGGAPLQGQAICYCGPNLDEFVTQFGGFGEVLYARKG